MALAITRTLAFTLSEMRSHEQRCCKRLYLGKRVTLAPVLLNGVGLRAKVRAGGKTGGSYGKLLKR